MYPWYFTKTDYTVMMTLKTTMTFFAIVSNAIHTIWPYLADCLIFDNIEVCNSRSDD